MATSSGLVLGWVWKWVQRGNVGSGWVWRVASFLVDLVEIAELGRGGGGGGTVIDTGGTSCSQGAPNVISVNDCK